MKNSLISIVLPTYNVQNYIARALQSCIDQSFRDIEIIIVDDCGSDESIKIAKEFAKKDERIKIIHNTHNLGLLMARYQGVRHSQGKYILFLDPDDFLEPQACEECVRILHKEGEGDFIWFGFLHHISGEIMKDDFLQDQNFSNFEYCKHVLALGKCPWNLCSKIIKKSTYLKAFSSIEKDRHLTMAEDALIYFFLVLHSSKIITSSKHIYHYCHNDSSSLGTNDITKIEKYLQEHSAVIETLSKFLSNQDLKSYLHSFFKSMITRLAMYKLGYEIKYYRLKYSYIKSRSLQVANMLKILMLRIKLMFQRYAFCVFCKEA
ncbi:Lipooligosaccharide biosynthesis galactosyltransferase [Helicobacter mustelae]|uniref:glycosyltransferase family 2 protein n=1 Tax=Helicobacter mustelae TaxID=217 RepID=UPI000E035141|nr:glycosyltransferase family 2 protein [Helicobacter mustelae]STP12508.1 Lipooligosaccharide biosynthesis galactosyltransferase [Helicobacter mustelae]